MAHLCFLIPDPASAKEVVQEILMIGVSDDRIHVIANTDTEIEDLPTADVLQESDVLGGAARGAVTGSATGMLAGLIVTLIPGAGVVTAGTAIAAGAVGGASFGLWIGSITGSSVPNSQLDQWQSEVDNGKILIVINTLDEETASVKKVADKREYQIIDAGEKGHIPLL